MFAHSYIYTEYFCCQSNEVGTNAGSNKALCLKQELPIAQSILLSEVCTLVTKAARIDTCSQRCACSMPKQPEPGKFLPHDRSRPARAIAEVPIHRKGRFPQLQLHLSREMLNRTAATPQREVSPAHRLGQVFHKVPSSPLPCWQQLSECCYSSSAGCTIKSVKEGSQDRASYLRPVLSALLKCRRSQFPRCRRSQFLQACSTR
jgi:hypothetical protein